MNKLYINKHIKIKNRAILIDGQEDYSNSNEDFISFIKASYKHYEIKYGKFYKMDALSKLGFLASELLLKDFENSFLPEEVALIFVNASSSLHTDIKFQNTISEVPSPSVFVYTLPNIVIGEICIRNDFKGETMFFVQDEFDTGFIYNYVENLFSNSSTKVCITGWLEMSENGEYHADLFLISQKDTSIDFNISNLNTRFIS